MFTLQGSGIMFWLLYFMKLPKVIAKRRMSVPLKHDICCLFITRVVFSFQMLHSYQHYYIEVRSHYY